MLDKMMRIAGRTDGGVAKAINVNADGSIATSKQKVNIPVKATGNKEINYPSEMNGFVISNDGAGDLDLYIGGKTLDIAVPNLAEHWESGTLYSSDGSEGVNADRLRTIERYPLPPSSYIRFVFDVAAHFILLQYNASNGYLGNQLGVTMPTTWVSGGSVDILTHPDADNYRLVIDSGDTTKFDSFSIGFENIPIEVKEGEVFDGDFSAFTKVDVITSATHRSYGRG